MAKQGTSTTASSSLAVFVVFLLLIAGSSSARILVDCRRSSLELPQQSTTGAGDVVLACEGASAKAKATESNGGFRSLRGCGGKLLLSMLPKGPVVPPSAPSRRTNDLNN